MNGPESSPKKPDGDHEEKRQQQSRRRVHFSLGFLITSLIVVWLFQQAVSTVLTRSTEISYNDFKNKLAHGQIADVTISETNIIGEMKNPKPNAKPALLAFNAVPAPTGDPKLI